MREVDCLQAELQRVSSLYDRCHLNLSELQTNLQKKTEELENTGKRNEELRAALGTALAENKVGIRV
jgi:chromosome segregation ATPase